MNSKLVRLYRDKFLVHLISQTPAAYFGPGVVIENVLAKEIRTNSLQI